MDLSEAKEAKLEDDGNAKICLFDTLFCDNRIKCYKIIYSFLPCQFQKWFAVYIKMLEMKRCITQLDNPAMLSGLPSHNDVKDIDFKKMLCQVQPFCAKAEQEKIASLLSALGTYEQYKSVMETMNLMKDIFPGGDSPFGAMDAASFDPQNMGSIMELLKTMNF